MSEQVRIYNDTTLPRLPPKKLNEENQAGVSNLRLFGCAFIGKKIYLKKNYGKITSKKITYLIIKLL